MQDISADAVGFMLGTFSVSDWILAREPLYCRQDSCPGTSPLQTGFLRGNLSVADSILAREPLCCRQDFCAGTSPFQTIFLRGSLSVPDNVFAWEPLRCRQGSRSGSSVDIPGHSPKVKHEYSQIYRALQINSSFE